MLNACVLKDNSHFEIDPGYVDKLVITKIQRESDTILKEQKVLSPGTEEFFIKKWNEAKPVGICKYAANYEIELILKSGRTRIFPINGCSIKENGDECFDTKVEALGDIIWENNQ